MVCHYFKSREQSCEYKSPHVSTFVAHHNTSNHRWQIGKSFDLPIVSGSNDNEEIRRKSPYHRAKYGKMSSEVECTEQDIEAKQICKDIPNIIREP